MAVVGIEIWYLIVLFTFKDNVLTMFEFFNNVDNYGNPDEFEKIKYRRNSEY